MSSRFLRDLDGKTVTHISSLGEEKLLIAFDEGVLEIKADSYQNYPFLQIEVKEKGVETDNDS